MILHFQNARLIDPQALSAEPGSLTVEDGRIVALDGDAPEGFKLGVFSTGPEVRDPVWNTITEAIGTFVLVFVIVAFGATPSGLGPLRRRARRSEDPRLREVRRRDRGPLRGGRLMAVPRWATRKPRRRGTPRW